MLKKISHIMIKAIIIVLCSIILGSAVMVALYSLPTDNMLRHAIQSKEMFSDIGRFDQWAYGLDYTKLDNFTDAVILLTALSNPYESPVKSAFLNPVLIDDASNFDAISNLNMLLDGENRGTVIYNYSRYWHGYLLFFKPLLLFFNAADIKVIMMMFQFFLVFGVLHFLWEEEPTYALFFSIVILFINPISTVLSFQYASIFSIALVTMIVMLKWKHFLDAKGYWWLVFLLDGIAVAFFDFLTYPMVAIGLPLITYLLITQCSCREAIKKTVAFSGIWLLGYAGMWVGKWIMTGIFIGPGSIKDGVSNVMIRTGSSYIAFRDCLKGIFFVINNRVMWLLAIFFVGITVLLCAFNKPNILKNAKDNAACMPALVLLLFYPFIWYFFVRNHTAVHPWMEFRQLAVSIWAILAIAAKLITQKKPRKNCEAFKHAVRDSNP